MKHSLPTVGLFVLLMCALLGACSGTSTNDAPLPTLARLPDGPTTPDAATAQANTQATLEGTVTQFPIVLPGTLEATALPTVESDLDFETFPDTLKVGDKLTLQGIFNTTDPNSGTGTLTNSKQQTVTLTVDPFTATTADKQLVQITGVVIQQPGDPTKTIQVSEISMVNDSSSTTNATDSPQGQAVPTSSIAGG